MAARGRAKRAPKRRRGGLKGEVVRMPRRAKKKAAGGIGHNSNGAELRMLTAEEERAEIDRLNRAYEAWQIEHETAKRAKAVYSQQCKISRKRGFDVAAYVEARRRDKADHGAIEMCEANTRRYLSVMGSALRQLDMFRYIESSEMAAEPPPPEASVVQ